MIKDPSLIRALSRCQELSDFFEEKFDLSNPEFIQALSKVKKLIVDCKTVPLSEDTVEELRTVLPHLTSLEHFSISSNGKKRVDVSSLFVKLSESIQRICLVNVDVENVLSFRKRDYPNLEYFYIEGSNIKHAPKIEKENSLVVLGDGLPNISPIECFFRNVNGQNVIFNGDKEISSVISALKKGTSVPLEVYEKYKSLFSYFGDKAISISIPDVSKLDLAKLEELKNNPNIKYIDIKSGLYADKQGEKYYYSLEQYAQIRSKIDEIISKVKVPDEKDPDREKKIFAQIYFLLGNMVDYDHYAISDEGKKDKQLLIDCRNLKSFFLGVERNGEVKNLAVCAGIADALKNVCACFGINGGYIKSFSEVDLESRDGGYFEKRNAEGKIIYQNGTDDPMGHAYNYFMLDGQKYFCDLTWDLVYIKQHIVPLPHFLNGIDEFFNSHKDVGFKKTDEHKDATVNYPSQNQMKLLEGTVFQKYFSTMAQTQELNKLMRQNYLCGFVSEYVDAVRNGRSSITVDELRDIFTIISQLEDAILNHRRYTDLGIPVKKGDKKKIITVPVSDKKKLEEMRKAINERRKEKDDR